MSDFPRSDSSSADAFSSWSSPRDAPSGVVENQLASRSNLRGRWLRIMALACSIAIHLALLFGLTVALPRKPAATIGSEPRVVSLQLRFIKSRLQAHSQPKALTSTLTSFVQKQPMILTPGVAQASKNEKTAHLSAVPDVVAIPQAGQGGNAPSLSDNWDIEPRNKRNVGANAGDYIQSLLRAAGSVMRHSNGGVSYRPTRFDSSWAPDRQNAVKQAIDRATFHSTIELPHGVFVDCVGGPSSPEPLATTVPVVPIASTHCHGSTPPAPMAAKALLDIQTLAPAQPLEAQGKPPPSAAFWRDSTNAAECATAPLPSGCRMRAELNAGSDENRRWQMAAPLPNSPAAPAH